MSSLGIDIGGTSVKLAMLERDKVLWMAQSPAYVRPNTDGLIAAIRAAAGGRGTGVECFGICVPGIYDRSSRRVTLAVNVPGLIGVPLEKLIEEALGRRPGRVEITSDAVATAIDIQASRALAGRLLVIALGTGIGAAVLDDGKPLLIDGNSPGHIGQFDVSLDDDPPIGPDGGAGSLEAYLGAPALVAKYGPDVPAAIRAFRGEDPPLIALARAVRICHAIYRPQHICLAGGIGIHLGHVLGGLRELIDRDLTNIVRAGWTLSVADDDLHAARGAARMAVK